MKIEMQPIGLVRTRKRNADISRHGCFSQVEEKLEKLKPYPDSKPHAGDRSDCPSDPDFKDD